MTSPASASFQDLNRKILNADLQQSAVIHFGQLALSDIALADLMRQAAALMAQVLAVEFLFVWELEEQTQTIALQASIGWKNQSAEDTWKPLEPHSLESLTLKSQYPILVENVRQETRFQPSSLLLDCEAVSGMCVSMGTVVQPFGVIEAFVRHPQPFAKDDVLFVQNIANLLALAISRRRLERDRESHGQRAGAPAGSQPRHVEWDGYEIKNRLIESREKERLRLAQELHDAPIQDLYGLIYQIDDLREAVRDSEGERIVDEYDQMLHNIVDSLRAICRNLRPPSLSPFGLEVAIRDHVERIREQAPQIHLHLDLMRDRQVLSDSLRLNLFRVYQQAMSNVLRHADALEVHVRFRWDDEAVILEVEDNGRGFELPAHWVEFVRREHFGLVGLAERVEGMRGKLEVVSAPGAGTLIRVVVPPHKADAQPRSYD